MKIEIEVDIPEGYEATGEYRYPRGGESFLDSAACQAVSHASGNWTRRIILRKVWTPGPN